MRPYRAFSVRLALFLAVCLLAGCSALRLGYASGDTVAYWWLNSYVDFTGNQKPWVKQEIDKLFAWHRKTQLKEYGKTLAQFQQQLRGPVSASDIESDYATLKRHAMVLADQALPALTELALSMQPQQIASMEDKFASNNEAYRKDHLRGSLEDRQAYRFKKVMKQAEYWFGNFNAQQEAQIRAASDARPLNNELWMAERLRRQQQLIGILKKIQAEHPSREAASAMLRDYAVDGIDMLNHQDNKAFFDDSRQGMVELVTKIVGVATPAQRAHAVKTMQNWIDDFRAMAAKAG